MSSDVVKFGHKASVWSSFFRYSGGGLETCTLCSSWHSLSSLRLFVRFSLRSVAFQFLFFCIFFASPYVFTPHAVIIFVSRRRFIERLTYLTLLLVDVNKMCQVYFQVVHILKIIIWVNTFRYSEINANCRGI